MLGWLGSAIRLREELRVMASIHPLGLLPPLGRTSKNGQDGLVDSLYLARMQDVAREEGYYEEEYEDGQGP